MHTELAKLTVIAPRARGINTYSTPLTEASAAAPPPPLLLHLAPARAHGSSGRSVEESRAHPRRLEALLRRLRILCRL